MSPGNVARDLTAEFIAEPTTADKVTHPGKKVPKIGVAVYFYDHFMTNIVCYKSSYTAKEMTLAATKSVRSPGYLACPICNEDTPSVRVLGKTAYVGHRRFLKKPHKWRRSLEFNGVTENKDPPREFNRDAIHDSIARLPNACERVNIEFGGVKLNLNVLQYLPPDIAKPLIELCLFFKQICSQTLMVDDMLKAQSKVIDILCNLELIYPPAFFDIMIHLVIHLPLEAIFGGPIRPRSVIRIGSPRIEESDMHSELFALACGHHQLQSQSTLAIVIGVRFVVLSRDERSHNSNEAFVRPGSGRRNMVHINSVDAHSVSDVVDEDDDIIDEEDPIPHDLADSDDEDLVNLDIDDGVNVVYSNVSAMFARGAMAVTWWQVYDRPPFTPDSQPVGGVAWATSKGTRKPNLGGRRAGWQHTRQETRNKSGPVTISGQMAGVMARIGTLFDMRFLTWKSDRWPLYRMRPIQHALQMIYNARRYVLRKGHWIPDSDGTYTGPGAHQSITSSQLFLSLKSQPEMVVWPAGSGGPGAPGDMSPGKLSTVDFQFAETLWARHFARVCRPGILSTWALSDSTFLRATWQCYCSVTTGEIILKCAEKEGTWTVNLGVHNRKKSYYVRRGLHEFCIANGLEAGNIIKFELIRDKGKPVAVISILSEKETRKRKAAQIACFKSIATACSIKKSVVNVPRDFAMSNGFVNMNSEEMIVMDEKQRLWLAKVFGTHKRVHIRVFKDIWVANGFKAGDEFVLKLVDNGKKLLMNLQMIPVRRARVTNEKFQLKRQPALREVGTPVVPYVVNGVGYEKGYYLADGEPIHDHKYLVSRRKNKTAILKRGCRKWHVKIDNDWVFGEGWEAFVRDNGVQDFDFVVFKHQGNMVFDTMVFDTSSCEREYPIHKARRACLEKKSYGKVKRTLTVYMNLLEFRRKKTPKVKDTYINISLKSEKSIIPDHNNHPYFIGTLKASSKKLITKIERIRDILTFEENTLTDNSQHDSY
ncbi:B3 DNA binding domain-containing protein [Tanacetum coccineum]